MFTVNISDLIGRSIAIIVCLAATIVFSLIFIKFIKDAVEDLRDGLMDESPSSIFPIATIGCIIAVLLGLSVIGLLYSIGIINVV